MPFVLRILLVALLAVLLLPSGTRASPHGDFYTVTSADLSGPPGSLIRYAPISLMSIYRAKAYRILYRSTDLAGKPIAVSGVAVISTYPAPAGGRPVVAWAHPTSGVSRHCAPSMRANPLDSIAGVKDMIPYGYAVVATDYPGLGVQGVVPYLIGKGEAVAVLDSVRALGQMQEAQASRRYVIWGYSQGGHAALFAAGLARSHAPDFKLAGVAAIAPPTALAEMLDDDIGTVAGRILAAMALRSWNRVLGLPLGDLLTGDAEAVVNLIDSHCVDNIGGQLDALGAEEKLGNKFLKVDPANDPPWSRAMTENSVGAHMLDMPVFIAQGLHDEIVAPAITKAFVGKLCAARTPVYYLEIPDADHGMSKPKGAPTAVTWIASAFAGAPQTHGCTR
ncbi:MAG: lipase family protein [Parvibaculaceae bacterium]